MKGRTGERLIIFGPLGFLRAFLFCCRLRRSGVEFKLCSRPRSVAVRERDLATAGSIYEELT